MASNAAHFAASPGYPSSSYQGYSHPQTLPYGQRVHSPSAGLQPSFLHANGGTAGSQRLSGNPGSQRLSEGSPACIGERRSSGGSSSGSPEQASAGEKKSARFGGPTVKNDYQEERSKILTMKYGKQQMMLIRKRLKVEMWLMDELETLYDDEDLAVKCDMDIDILLDLDTDAERRDAILKKLSECPATKQDTEEFIKNFLERLQTL